MFSKYEIPATDWGTTDLREEHLVDCESFQDPRAIAFAKKKALSVASCLDFANYSERLTFLDAFMKGYFAAFCTSEEERALELELSPLGKALK